MIKLEFKTRGKIITRYEVFSNGAYPTLFLNGECFKLQEQQLKHWQFKCALCSSSTSYDFKMMHLEGHFMFHSWIA